MNFLISISVLLGFIFVWTFSGYISLTIVKILCIKSGEISTENQLNDFNTYKDYFYSFGPLSLPVLGLGILVYYFADAITRCEFKGIKFTYPTDRINNYLKKCLKDKNEKDVETNS